MSLEELQQSKAGTRVINNPASAKHVTMCGWDDVPHLDEQTKKELLESTPVHLRKARMEGAPSLGQGAIYTTPEEEIRVEPFRIPAYWARAYALDVGWNRTAAIWAAIDRDTDTAYLYSEHYRGQAEPVVHAEAIKARGEWIPGAIDPAARGRSQIDGKNLLHLYRSQGLSLTPADNAVEAGIFDVGQRLSMGKLKVFSTCTNWFAEYRLYHRDEHGNVVKKRDHLMDTTRYVIRTGLRIAITQPVQIVPTGTSVADPIGGY